VRFSDGTFLLFFRWVQTEENNEYVSSYQRAIEMFTEYDGEYLGIPRIVFYGVLSSAQCLRRTLSLFTLLL
jgi:hypothetical protein